MGCAESSSTSGSTTASTSKKSELPAQSQRPNTSSTSTSPKESSEEHNPLSSRRGLEPPSALDSVVPAAQSGQDQQPTAGDADELHILSLSPGASPEHKGSVNRKQQELVATSNDSNVTVTVSSPNSPAEGSSLKVLPVPLTQFEADDGGKVSRQDSLNPNSNSTSFGHQQNPNHLSTTSGGRSPYMSQQAWFQQSSVRSKSMSPGRSNLTPLDLGLDEESLSGSWANLDDLLAAEVDPNLSLVGRDEIIKPSDASSLRKSVGKLQPLEAPERSVAVSIVDPGPYLPLLLEVLLHMELYAVKKYNKRPLSTIINSCFAAGSASLIALALSEGIELQILQDRLAKNGRSLLPSEDAPPPLIPRAAFALGGGDDGSPRSGTGTARPGTVADDEEIVSKAAKAFFHGEQFTRKSSAAAALLGGAGGLQRKLSIHQMVGQQSEQDRLLSALYRKGKYHVTRACIPLVAHPIAYAPVLSGTLSRKPSVLKKQKLRRVDWQSDASVWKVAMLANGKMCELIDCFDSTTSPGLPAGGGFKSHDGPLHNHEGDRCGSSDHASSSGTPVPFSSSGPNSNWSSRGGSPKDPFHSDTTSVLHLGVTSGGEELDAGVVGGGVSSSGVASVTPPLAATFADGSSRGNSVMMAEGSASNNQVQHSSRLRRSVSHSVHSHSSLGGGMDSDDEEDEITKMKCSSWVGGDPSAFVLSLSPKATFLVTFAVDSAPGTESTNQSPASSYGGPSPQDALLHSAFGSNWIRITIPSMDEATYQSLLGDEYDPAAPSSSSHKRVDSGETGEGDLLSTSISGRKMEEMKQQHYQKRYEAMRMAGKAYYEEYKRSLDKAVDMMVKMGPGKHFEPSDRPAERLFLGL